MTSRGHLFSYTVVLLWVGRVEDPIAGKQGAVASVHSENNFISREHKCKQSSWIYQKYEINRIPKITIRIIFHLAMYVKHTRNLLSQFTTRLEEHKQNNEQQRETEREAWRFAVYCPDIL